MERKRRNVLAYLLAGLVLPSCTLLSGSDAEPTRSPDSGSASTSSSSSSSSSSTGGSGTNVTGSGSVKSEERRVSAFDRVSINGIGELIIEQTGAESLTIEAEDNLLPLLVSEVEGNRLTLGVRPNSSISATRPIVYRLNVKLLREITAEGSVRVAASGLDTAQFALNTSGTVNSVLRGSAGNQSILMSGTGSFDGRNLTGSTAQVDLSGTAQALLNVSKSLDARVSGTAVVRYLGSPQLEQQVSGIGRVEKVT